MRYSITEAIVAGNWSADEIAVAYGLSESEAKGLIAENDRRLNDSNVSEEEYEEWCDREDKIYGDSDVAAYGVVADIFRK